MTQKLTRGNDPQWRRMFAIAAKFPLTDEEHREFASMVLGRDITSRKQMTPIEVRMMVAAYNGYLLMAHLMREARDDGRRFEEPEA